MLYIVQLNKLKYTDVYLFLFFKKLALGFPANTINMKLNLKERENKNKNVYTL